MKIFKMLDLSTAHLPAELCSNGLLNDVPGVLVIMDGRYGYLVYVPVTNDLWDDRERCPEPVARILRYARDHDCDYIYLDADGEVVPDLPCWEWGR